MANISSRTIARADPTDLGFINSRGRGAISWAEEEEEEEGGEREREKEEMTRELPTGPDNYRGKKLNDRGVFAFQRVYAEET